MSDAPAPAPELLAPAGDLDCVRAAIENGADAVYFGLHGHNARARATNFDVESLPELMRQLHHRGVKGYVTLNTLAFSSELEEIERIIRRVAMAGADAIIVQDIAVIRLARAICPDLPIHASTQMTLTSAESIQIIKDLGVQRVILARELNLDDMRRIRRDTQMPLEVFVHGALCVAYSGQCLTSEALGGRSANRGQCAQACRLPYEVLSDGVKQELGDYQYVLSPQDLAAWDVIPELVKLGIACFKIEGRLKTPEYVANITRHYRQAIDAAMAGHPVLFTRRDVQEMELSFSRGFSHGWMKGDNHKELVVGRSPTKRGVYLGEVQRIAGGRVSLKLAADVKRGDGIVFDRGRPEEPEQGGRVYELFRRGQPLTESDAGGEVELAFGRHDIDWKHVSVGDRVWKTDDPELTRRLRQSFAGSEPKRRVPLAVRVSARVGERLQVSASAASGATAVVESPDALVEAVQHPITEALLTAQLGRLGATVYELQSLIAVVDGRPMIPLSVLGKLRREMVERLDASLKELPQRTVMQESAVAVFRQQIRRAKSVGPLASGDVRAVKNQGTTNQGADAPRSPSATLRVLCRSLMQLDVVLEAGVGDLYADFQDIREYAAAVERAHAASARLFLATPRIQKPAEGPLFKHLLRHKADGVLARNLGGLEFYVARGVPVVADFSLNAANEISVEYLRARGAARVTASYDLNREQLLDLVAATPPEWLEVVLHQHMPMFHMEHCVFCAVLSPGTNRTNCGRPCDRHEVRLRDRVGMEHTLKADVGCRNTLYNAVPQSGAELAAALMQRGVADYRIELLNETPAEVRRTIDLYRQLLQGRATGQEVWTRLKAINRVGVTRGPLET